MKVFPLKLEGVSVNETANSHPADSEDIYFKF